MAPWIVNVQASGDRPGPSVGHTFETKRAARGFIRSLGRLALDAKVGRRTYSVRVKPKS